MRHPLHVAFVWHMHQPYYLDEGSGEYILPWVRLHATKDYLHMVEVLEDFPQIHATFNMVPSLVEQLQGYVSGSILDRAWKVSLQEQYSQEDKAYMDSLFFSANRETFIRSYPRYWQLLRMKEEAKGDLDLLGEGYWRDLAAWFNLAWIDPSWLQRDPVLRALVAKGSRFSLQDIATILEKQREMMGVALTTYRRLQRRGQVELSVSPYYHPILPLLIDSNCATEPSPWLRLPTERFQWKEDALAQLKQAVEFHEEYFERPPAGLWPSEGSVSQDLLNLLAELPEIRWVATDEAILAKSLGINLERNGWGYLLDPRPLYQPYLVRRGTSTAAMIFRDHYISDRIGFAYQGMSGRSAAEDLMFRFVAIHEMIKDDPEPYLLPIILDGENCWEHYERNGETFLRSLYEMLSSSDRVRTVTVSEFLNEYPLRREIPRVATGSWINGNLETWIGEDTQNRGWEYLVRTRRALDEAESRGDVQAEMLEKAWRCMKAAEGSDWFWWYYSHNVSDQDDLFDSLFRQNLAGVFQALGKPVPEWIDIPIISQLPKLASRAPSAYIRPLLTEGDLSPEPWGGSGYLDPKGSTGSMQQGSGLLKRLYFGYDERSLYLRVESHSSLRGYVLDIYFSKVESIALEKCEDGARRGAIVQPKSGCPLREMIVRPDNRCADLNRWEENAGWTKTDASPTISMSETVLEIAVSLETLGIDLGTTLGLSMVVFKDGLMVQRLPEDGELLLELAVQRTEC